ncbi:MAG TPA: HEPN domain-containing protein [Thermodesulfobacteriota bacterium]|nr:HEPN domain-containing protein [Deltaproteobacteria bacterium]HNR12801.1 HEPN domain-containing protein [Thermodesulfobacteriota bacterium]HNU70353.1 HEPN domain-containing protein [Thermodesulfobacteriota bacterium]
MKSEDIEGLIRHRLNQAQEALEEARILQEAGRSGLGLVNRSYYAMFYAVLALLQQTEQLPRKHQGAISAFDKEFVKRGLFSADMSKDLHRAFELRQVSDYQITTPLTRAEAEEIFNRASLFVSAVARYLLPMA